MRVYLRRPTSEDAESFLKATRGSEAFHRPWVYPPTSRTGFFDYLDRIHENRHEGFFICRRVDGCLAGIANLNEIVRGGVQAAYLGYWGVAGLSGQGLLTEGIALVLDEAFGRLGLHRLEVNIQPNNHRSIRLVERLGLRKEGFSPRYMMIGEQWRDHERWALTAEEWTGSERFAPKRASVV